MKRIFIRIDCSDKVGLGHLKRAVSLCDYFTGSSIDLYVKGNVGEENLRDLPFSNIYSVNSGDLLSEIYHGRYGLGIFDFSTNDTRVFSHQLEGYFQRAKEVCDQTLVIDGIGNDFLLENRPRISIDYLLIPYFGAPELNSTSFRYFHGPEYFVFSSEVRRTEKKELSPTAKNILLTFGGSDPFGLTSVFLRTLLSLDLETKIIVVCGPLMSKAHKDDLKILSGKSHLVELIDGSHNFLSHLSDAQACISASGLTKYELARLGIPSGIVSLHSETPSQEQAFLSSTGFLDMGGTSLSDTEVYKEKLLALIRDSSLRKTMSLKSKNLFSSTALNALLSNIEASI